MPADRAGPAGHVRCVRAAGRAELQRARQRQLHVLGAGAGRRVHRPAGRRRGRSPSERSTRRSPAGRAGRRTTPRRRGRSPGPAAPRASSAASTARRSRAALRRSPPPALSQGSHTFAVRALSVSGAPDPTPDTRTITVDSVAPETTITGGPTGAVSSTSAAFTFTSNESGVTFQCSLDGAAFGTCPASYTGLSQGAHTFQVRARDAAGNIDGSPATRTWTVDTSGPTPRSPAGRPARWLDQRDLHLHLHRGRRDLPVLARRRRLRRLPGRLHRARAGRAHVPGPRTRRRRQHRRARRPGPGRSTRACPPRRSPAARAAGELHDRRRSRSRPTRAA